MAFTNPEARNRKRVAVFLVRCAKQLGLTPEDIAKRARISIVTAQALFDGSVPYMGTIERVGVLIQEEAANQQRKSVLDARILARLRVRGHEKVRREKTERKEASS